jgi:hypothetical protein
VNTENSRWARPDHTPCPTHGLAHVDEAGRCLPSCGFGWDTDPLLIVRDEAVSA